MNRLEFMERLEQLLAGIPETEKQEALRYYEDYFEDAGVESEQEVLESLGSPEEIARSIRGNTEQEYGECKDAGRSRVKDAPAAVRVPPKNSEMSSGLIVLLVFLGIFTSPVLASTLSMLFSLVTGILEILTGLIVLLAVLVVGSGVLSLVLFAGALVLMVYGPVKMFETFSGGMMLFGTGLLSAGFAILFMLLTVFLAAVAVPAFFRGLIWLCKAPFHKNISKEGKK